MGPPFATTDDGPRRQFWTEGFVVPEGFTVPVDLLQEVRAAAQGQLEIRAGRVGTLEIFDLRKSVPAVARLVSHCLPVANQLAGRDDMRCTFDELFVSLPGAPEGTSWHQDEGGGKAARLRITRRDTSIAFWVPLHSVDVHNGTLRYIPRSHRTGLIPHAPEAGGRRFIPDYTNDVDAVTVPLKAGQCVVHNGLVIHRAHPNTTDGARWSMAIQFRPGRSQFFARRRLGHEWMTRPDS